MPPSLFHRAHDSAEFRRFLVNASVGLLWLLPLLLTVLFTAAGSARAQGTSSDQEPNWIPYFELGFDSSDDESSGTATSAFAPNADGQNSFDDARIRFGVGVLSPNWTPIPGEPRLFLQAGVDIHTAESHRPLDSGEIGTPEDDIARVTPGRGTDPEDIGGQGVFIRQEFYGTGWYAGFGVAFSIPAPWDEGRIRLKPVAAYEGERVRFAGRLTQVTEPTEDVFIVHRASALTDARTEHRLGVGGEIEMVFFEGDRVEISAYGNARYMWLLGGRSAHFTDSTGLAGFEWRGSANVIRGGLGIRVGWTGFGR